MISVTSRDVTTGGDEADCSVLVEREVCPPLHRRRAEPPLVLPPKHVAAVMPDEARPKGVEVDRWISINLFEQRLAVYEEGRLIFATRVSTGLQG